MNKVVNINLGGIPFTMDEDAYDHLRGYLDVIYRHFRDTEGYEEITTDIESRLAELFQEGLANRPIVGLKDVEEAIRIMGTPEDFGADDEISSASEDPTYKTGKRLFRSPDDVVLGGVSSGIAAYFGINEPLWIRLAFVLLTLTGTFGIPIYLVLWAIIPKAKTAADKLAMRGEPINVSNIGKLIQKEFESLSKEVSDITQEINGKRKNGISATDQFTRGLQEVFQIVGKLLRQIIHLLSQIWKPLLLLIGGILIFILASAWMGTVIGLFAMPPYLNLFLAHDFLANWIFPINILLLIGIPIAFGIMGISRLLFKSRTSIRLQTGLGILWAVNLCSLLVLAGQTGRQFRIPSEVEHTHLLSPTQDTLTIKGIDVVPPNELFDIDNKIYFQENGITYRGVRIKIRPADDNRWKLVVRKSARGKSTQDAELRATGIAIEPSMKNNVLELPNALTIAEGQKFRVQHVIADLFVPQGKYIRLTETACQMVISTHVPSEATSSDTNVPLLMTQNGLECESCLSPNTNSTTWGTLTDLHHTNFDEIRISGPIKVRIENKADYEFQLTGPQLEGVDKVEIDQEGNVLSIHSEATGTSLPRLFLGLPSLKALHLDHTSDVRISGLKEGTFQLFSEGDQDIKMEMDIGELTLKHSGKNEIDLGGSIDELTAILDHQASLDAEKARLTLARLTLINNSRAYLPSHTKLGDPSTDPNSQIYQE